MGSCTVPERGALIVQHSFQTCKQGQDDALPNEATSAIPVPHLSNNAEPYAIAQAAVQAL